MNNSFSEILKSRQATFEEFFHKRIFKEIQGSFHPRLAEAAIYSLSAGGKRIRPILVLSAYLSRFSQDLDSDAFYMASALECIHTYSLIHDDLPSMDDDDYRRGVLTCHKKYSESTAILAGDALNSFGFFLVSKLAHKKDNTLLSDILAILHTGAGGPGMVSGQIEDLENEAKKENVSLEVLERIHARKTGALITASLLIGNRLLEDYKEYEDLFREYGKKIGMLFQITDDIIDSEGSFEEIGKTPGKDAAKGKLTYPNFFGLEKTKRIRDQLTEELMVLGEKIETKAFFKDLPKYIAKRKA